jgi:hypothetical protein
MIPHRPGWRGAQRPLAPLDIPERVGLVVLFAILCTLGAIAFVAMILAASAALAAPLPADATWRAPDGRTIPQLIAAHVLPDPATTPGAAYSDDPALPPVTIAQVCVAGWTKTVRPPTSFTNRIRASLTPAGYKPGDGELDHLQSIEDLGYPGRVQNVALSRRNLWWMIYADRYGARVKDVLETKLHRLLCAGKITPADARAALIPNWLVGYQRYVGPLP